MSSLVQRLMKSGVCPNCGSAEVHAGLKVVPKGGVYGSNTIPISIWYGAILENYVCVACGYVESYISDPAKLRKIKEKWPRVK